MFLGGSFASLVIFIFMICVMYLVHTMLQVEGLHERYGYVRVGYVYLYISNWRPGLDLVLLHPLSCFYNHIMVSLYSPVFLFSPPQPHPPSQSPHDTSPHHRDRGVGGGANAKGIWVQH